ncbi:hypothetical protein CPB85DRAFT_1436155 [Mucidula mucida]|nr:hypothetical protein CPB85DRAFT_1436155 [Mucidula mucida]
MSVPPISPSSSPPSNDDNPMNGILAAMKTPQASCVLGKRPTPNNEDFDELKDDSAPGGTSGNPLTTNPFTTPTGPNPNDLIAVKNFAARKKLKTEQLAEVEVFLQDPPHVRDAKTFALLHSVFNKVEEIVVATPAFEVSDNLRKNINSYSVAMLLSSHIASYKGAPATDSLLKLLLRLPLGIPAGITANAADYNRLQSAVSDALTQTRATFKKHLAIRRKGGPEPDIFTLARTFIKNTKCELSMPLCCRIALMRMVFKKHAANDFWDKLDAQYAVIVQVAKGSATALVRAFEFIYESDKKQHIGDGSGVGPRPDASISGIQQQVDDLMLAAQLDVMTTAAAATSAAQQAAESSSPDVFTSQAA